MAELAEAGDMPPKKKRAKLRLLLLVVLFFSLLYLGRSSGVVPKVNVAYMQELVRSSGSWGMAVFVLAFATGLLLQIPGMIFIAAGILVYGKAIGYWVCLVGALVAVTASFLLVRLVGGKALTSIDNAFLRRSLLRLEEKPVRWVIILRAIFLTAPPLNYGLALSNVRLRDYFVGSLLGLIVPMLVVTTTFDYLFSTPWAKRLLF